MSSSAVFHCRASAMRLRYRHMLTTLEPAGTTRLNLMSLFPAATNSWLSVCIPTFLASKHCICASYGGQHREWMPKHMRSQKPDCEDCFCALWTAQSPPAHCAVAPFCITNHLSCPMHVHSCDTMRTGSDRDGMGDTQHSCSSRL